MRITVFLGAGMNLDIGGPSTDCLTCLVRRRLQQISKIHNGKVEIEYVNFLNQIAEKLDAYYSPHKCNFEEIFHSLELLYSFNRGWKPKTKVVSRYKPPECAFISPRDCKWFNEDMIHPAQKEVISIIAERIFKFINDYKQQENNSWFKSFWQKAIEQCPLDIGTLNYDNCVELSVPPNMLEDGYEDTEKGLYKFNPRQILETKKSKILHLHGSIFYGYPPNSAESVYEYDHEDLYKFNDCNEAKKNWLNRSHNNDQSKKQSIIGPIITGLNKAAKLLHYPYNIYHNIFTRALIENSRLLVIGYGFNDFHFNCMLAKMTKLHKGERKIVFITKVDDESEWCTDPSVMSWINPEMYDFVAKSFCDNRPFKSVEFQDQIISDDRCATLYLRGFKDAVENYGDKIIDFLTSK